MRTFACKTVALAVEAQHNRQTRYTVQKRAATAPRPQEGSEAEWCATMLSLAIKRNDELWSVNKDERSTVAMMMIECSHKMVQESDGMNNEVQKIGINDPKKQMEKIRD